MALDADTEKGRAVLVHFHNYNVTNFPDVYKIDFQTLIATISAKPGATFFLEGLGLAANSNAMDDEQCEKAMIALAKQSQGRIPESWQTFFKALTDQVQDISWVDLTKNTAIGVAGDVVSGLSEVGNVAMDTFKSLGAVLPILVVGGVIFYVYNKVKK